MDSIVLVFWYTEMGHRQMIAFENQERADAFMNAHPYRGYYFTKLMIQPEDIRERPRTWFPE